MTHKDHKPVWVNVRVYDADGAEDQNRTGDHNTPEFRAWMGKTAWWAFRNNRRMMVMPVSAPESKGEAA